MRKYVPDTHTLLWYVDESSLLGPAANAALSEVERGEAVLAVPAIVLAELFYLLKKQKRKDEFAPLLEQLCTTKHVEATPLVIQDVLAMQDMPEHLEMHDRLIICAARRLGASLLTMDREVVESKTVPTIWYEYGP
jgi:PIN domain nuclease of toxin-antitoxin system